MNEQHAIGAHGFPLSYVEESEAYYKHLALIDQREWTRNVRRYPTLYNFDQIGTCIDHEQNGFGSDACQINAFDRCPVCQDILEGEIRAAEEKAGWPTVHASSDDDEFVSDAERFR